MVTCESASVDESEGWSSRDLMQTGRIGSSHELGQTASVDATIQFDVTQSEVDSFAGYESHSPDQSRKWLSQDLLETRIPWNSYELGETAGVDGTLQVDVTQAIVESRLFIHSPILVLSSQHRKTDASLSIPFGVTSEPAITAAQYPSNTIQLSVDFIASETELRSQVFNSDRFIRSNVFTGSVYFVEIDEQSEHTVDIVHGSAAAGASAGVGLLGLAGLMLFLLKRRYSNESDLEDPMEYDTDGHEINVEEEESEGSEDDDWDVDEFDRVVESTFVNGQEPTHVMYETSDHLFPTDCDEIL
jgi:hypothetical protein